MLKFQYQTYGLEYHSILAKMKSLVFMIIKHFFSLKPYTRYPGISKNYSMSNNHGTPLSLTCKLLAFAANAFICFCYDH